MDRELLDEIIKIRKTLEDIEFILEYAHVPQKHVDRRIAEKGGRIKKYVTYYTNPLEHLRLSLNERRQNESDNSVVDP